MQVRVVPWLRVTRTSRAAITASAPSWPQQRHGHVPTCSLLLPRVLQPSAFHTLMHTRVHLIALVIQQTPALCFALVHGTWQRQEGGQSRQEGSPAPIAEGRAAAAAPAVPGAQWGEHSPSTAFPCSPCASWDGPRMCPWHRGGWQEGTRKPL